MRKTFLLFFPLVLFSFTSGIGQVYKEIIIAVDSTEFKIGEQINIRFQVKGDSLSKIQFPEQPNFAPFELLEIFPLDTIRAQTHYLFTKKYALIQFDSGNYWIPKQKILINGVNAISDSISIRINTVVVDTLKQPLFDIKPLVKLERGYKELTKQIAVIFFIFLVLAFLIFLGLRFQKKREEKREKIPPFERALLELKALEEERPRLQEEYKSYYSKLTEVVRRYLEEEANITALESTSKELLKKLELLIDAGKLDLSTETLLSLKQVLEHADLVKFARSAPEFEVATSDRNIVEDVVIKTQEALPEPTQEEIEATAAFQKELKNKKFKFQLKIAGLGILVLTIIVFLISIYKYGFENVKDTLIQYPTKVLMNNQWVQSQYGTPPIFLSTPEVLIRKAETQKGITIFSAGDPLNTVYVQINFLEQAPPEEGKEKSEEEQQQEAQDLINEILASLEQDGATNMLINPDPYKTKDGSEVIQLSGTLDLLNPESKERTRCRLRSIILPFNQVQVELRILYDKEDRYGEEIENRIIESLEVLKEL
ncbi:MAG: BatD family protein [Flavobacteriaceae bacterium]|nr:BatD family protein [Flavobacteriaceae bacterium]